MNIQKVIEKVRKHEPTAFPHYTGDGWVILKENPDWNLEYDSEDDQFINLFSEYLFTPQKTIDEAWNIALLCCKTTQNFNRTHPDRMELESEDDDRYLEVRISKIQSGRRRNKERAISN